MNEFRENDYLRLNINLMYAGGTFKIKSENKVKRTLYQLWRISLNLMLLHANVTVSVDLIQKGYKNFVLGILNYNYIAASVCVWLRLNYFYIFDGSSEDIVKEMYALFKCETRTGLEEKHMRQSLCFVKAIMLLWLIVGTVAAQSIIILPLLFSKDSRRTLPIPMWFPYDWRISPYYELTVLYQLFYQQAIATAMIGMDMFFTGLVILTAKQFRLLGWEIKNLLHTVLIMNGFDRETVLTIQMRMEENPRTTLANSELIEKFKVDLLELFNQLVMFHQSLLLFCNRLEDFFSPSYLSYFLIVFIMIILFGFLVATTQNIALTIIFSVCLISTSGTLFIPCCFGEILTTQAEAFFYDVYQTPWYICDEKFKVHFKCLQQKACKPTYITVGKFANLSLNAFLWIEQTMISYVMVLYQLTRVTGRQ